MMSICYPGLFAIYERMCLNPKIERNVLPPLFAIYERMCLNPENERNVFAKLFAVKTTRSALLKDFFKPGAH